MFRTLTLAAATALVAGTAFANDAIFLELAKQDDNRALVQALENDFNTAPSAKVQGIFAEIAAQDDNRVVEDAITGGQAFSSKNAPGVSPLEVALKHAIESDNRALIASLEAKLGR